MLAPCIPMCYSALHMGGDSQRTFRLPADLDTKLVAKAEELDRSVSWVIIRCLEIELLGPGAAQAKALMRGAAKNKGATS
jgi:predicted transcriptional regulator